MVAESPVARTRWVGLLAGWIAAALQAQAPYRVADLNRDSWHEVRGGSCRGYDFISHVGRLPGFVVADLDGDGCRIFEADPAAGTLTQVAHLGEVGARVEEVYGAAGGRTYFEGITAATGRELWRTDGTPEGTFLLLDATPGPAQSYGFRDFAAGDPWSYFYRHLAETGWEPWRTDGTPEGTTILADLNPGAAGSGGGWTNGFHPTGFWGPYFFFLADDGIHGAEVWRTDGTAAGTFPMTAFEPDAYADSVADFAALPAAMLFSAWTYGGPVELWRVGGPTKEVERLLTVPVGTSAHVRPLAVRGDRALLEIDKGGAIHLWVTDGTVEGTLQVIDLPQAAAPSFGRPQPVANGWIFFARGGAHGVEPWTTDGTPEGTHLLFDVRPGPEDSAAVGWSTATLGDRALLRLDDGVHGRELWITDGTAVGTRLVADLEPGREDSRDLILLGEQDGHELFEYEGRVWATDGTTAGTVPIGDLGRTVSPSDPLRLARVGEQVYFDALGAPWVRHPFRSDGSEVGTSWLGSTPVEWLYGRTHFADLGDGTFVANTDRACDDRYGYSELWSGDEILAPVATLVYDCGARCTTGLGQAPPVAGGFALYVDWSPELGTELWRTDGTPGGTSPLVDLFPGEDPAWPPQLHPVGGEVWFTAVDAGDVESVWRSRGTPETTEVVGALPGTTGEFDRASVWPIDPAIGSYFARRFENGTSVLRYSAGFGQPPEILATGVYFFGPGPLGVVGGRILFAGVGTAESPTGVELWVSDGTPEGTRLLRDIWPGEPDSSIGAGFVVGGRVIFPACDPAGGCELWASDGTEAGTGRFLDLEPGPGSSRPTGLSKIGSQLYFAACRIASGCEGFVTNGTAAGTRPLEEVAAGPLSSLPFPWLAWVSEYNGLPWDPAEPLFVEAGDRIFFAADDGTGTELWAIVHGLFRDGFESGDTGRWSGALP
jgi:ELWxxDGT repeat protein